MPGWQETVTPEPCRMAFKTQRTVVRYRGIHRFSRSEGQGEPYAIVGVYGSESRDTAVIQKFPIGRGSYTNFVSSTDASESGEISLDWAPLTLVIISTVMEHHSGDPDRIAARVEEGIKKAAVAARADPAHVSGGACMPDDLDIPGLIADVLGLGDELIGIQPLQINASDIASKRPMQQFGTISSNFESPLLSDGEASYKLFYEVFFEEVTPTAV